MGGGPRATPYSFLRDRSRSPCAPVAEAPLQCRGGLCGLWKARGCGAKHGERLGAVCGPRQVPRDPRHRRTRASGCLWAATAAWGSRLSHEASKPLGPVLRDGGTLGPRGQRACPCSACRGEPSMGAGAAICPCGAASWRLTPSRPLPCRGTRSVDKGLRRRPRPGATAWR